MIFDKEIKKCSKFKLVLSILGESTFKGKNIEVMKPNLKEFKTIEEVNKHFLKIGTSNKAIYNVLGLLNNKWEWCIQ